MVVVVGRINDEHETRHNPIQAKAHSTKLLYMRGTVMERGEREREWNESQEAFMHTLCILTKQGQREAFQSPN